MMSCVAAHSAGGFIDQRAECEVQCDLQDHLPACLLRGSAGVVHLAAWHCSIMPWPGILQNPNNLSWAGSDQTPGEPPHCSSMPSRGMQACSVEGPIEAGECWPSSCSPRQTRTSRESTGAAQESPTSREGVRMPANLACKCL